MKPSLLRSTLLGLFLLAGCGSDSVKLSQLDDAYANAYCDILRNCPRAGFDSTIERLIAQSPGATSCEEAVLAEGDLNLGAYQASVDAGRIRYDGSAAKTCLDALSAACVSPDARQASAISPACDRIWKGQVELGGVCTLDADCEGAARCEKPDNSCTGTCVALRTIGESCGSNSQCDQNIPNGYAVCEPTTTNPNDHCVAVTVTENVAGGGACGMVVTTGDAWEYAYCRTNLYCRRSSTNNGFWTGVCATPIELGAACVPGTDVCAGDAACVQNAGGATGSSCQNVTIVSTVGAACGNDIRTYCNPFERLDCDNDVCVQVGTGALGQPCRKDYATDCDPGLYCDENGGGTYDGFCATKLVDGAPCDPSIAEACLSGYCDDRTNPNAPVCSTVMCGG